MSKTEKIKKVKTESTVKPVEKSGIGTYELYEMTGIPTKRIRSVLRSLPEYNDGKFTNYRWTGPNDPNVKKILTILSERYKIVPVKKVRTGKE
jgi:hypothetical protein